MPEKSHLTTEIASSERIQEDLDSDSLTFSVIELYRFFNNLGNDVPTHPQMGPIIESLDEQRGIYKNLVENSVAVAKTGAILSQKAIRELGGNLNREEAADREDIFVQSTRSFVQAASAQKGFREIAFSTVLTLMVSIWVEREAFFGGETPAPGGQCASGSLPSRVELDSFIENFGALCHWWGAIETEFKDILLDPNDHVEVVRERWYKIDRLCTSYQKSITSIQHDIATCQDSCTENTKPVLPLIPFDSSSFLKRSITLYQRAHELQQFTNPSDNFPDNLGLALRRRFSRTGQVGCLNEAILLYQMVLKLLPASHIQRSPALDNLATSFHLRFGLIGQTRDLAEAISLHRKALELHSESPNTDRSLILNNLATALQTRFGQAGSMSDLEEAISLHREALRLRPPAHPDRSASLNDLALALQRRFNQNGQLCDLNETISLHRTALEAFERTQSRDGLSASLNNLATALQTRFLQTGQMLDLREAISFYQRSLELRPVPHPYRPTSLANLAAALEAQFGQTGQMPDLEGAVLFQREALELRPSPHPERPSSLNNLAIALQIRFSQSGQLSDLQEAILLHRQALEYRPAPHPQRSKTLDNLAVALKAQFGQTGQMSDLDEAITFHRESLELRSANHSNRSISLNNLATSLQIRFIQTDQVSDLQEAILLHREALELRPPPHPYRSTSLDNLAAALGMLFNYTGEILDLDEAIISHRRALELRPLPHPDRSASLNNFAMALQVRFAQINQMPDLLEAISLHRQALALRPPPNPDRSSSLNSLAITLKSQFLQTQQISILEEAIVLYREALELLDEHNPYRHESLNNLADTLRIRFSQTHQIPDLDEAISLHRTVLGLCAHPYPSRSGSLHNLSNVLKLGYESTNILAYLEESVALSLEALRGLPHGHPHICSFSNVLGDALYKMYTRTSNKQYLEESMDAFRVAATSESPSAVRRFQVARHWARIAHKNHELALEAYAIAIGLLPRIAMLGLDIQSRQEALGVDGADLTWEAAACAIQDSQFDKAVELLEEGRAIFWSQGLKLRTPLDELKDKDQDLGLRLERVAHSLESGSFRDATRTQADSPQRLVSLDEEAADSRRLNNEWQTLLEEVRMLEGFHDFLRTKTISVLRKASLDGPVVILNAAEARCDALIVMPSRVQHVPLPDFTLATAAELINQMQSIPGISRRDSDSRSLKVRSLAKAASFRSILGTLWRAVVEPIIRLLGLKKSKTPLRIWWCPTGLFSFLPIHAAGIYNNKANDSVLNYAVSSYTPTLSGLLSPPPVPEDTLKMMVVIQPDTPGYPSLPHTKSELAEIEKHVSNQSLVRLGTPDSPATIETVVSNLTSASVVHFACHGVQHVGNPLESAIILSDGRLTVSHIMQQPLPHARLVFLSACQTAMGDVGNPDEVMHIAATLLFAGFHGAVATMWSIHDEDGPIVADYFYGELYKPTVSAMPRCLDISQAARALHLATMKMWDERIPFERWVPFIHMGS